MLTKATPPRDFYPPGADRTHPFDPCAENVGCCHVCYGGWTGDKETRRRQKMRSKYLTMMKAKQAALQIKAAAKAKGEGAEQLRYDANQAVENAKIKDFITYVKKGRYGPKHAAQHLQAPQLIYKGEQPYGNQVFEPEAPPKTPS